MRGGQEGKRLGCLTVWEEKLVIRPFEPTIESISYVFFFFLISFSEHKHQSGPITLETG